MICSHWEKAMPYRRVASDSHNIAQLAGQGKEQDKRASSSISYYIINGKIKTDVIEQNISNE